jgi:tRNA/rRNA methyltransferase
MIDIILMEPEHPGNVGAAARIMKNFEFKSLVLINPKCNHLDKEAIRRAKHAGDVLKKAKIGTKQLLKKYDYLVGTSSIIGTDYNIPRSPITPEQLAERLAEINGKIGLIFGREGSGLSNEEIRKCDFMATIPSSAKYAALNMSHAMAIVLYEIFRKTAKPEERIVPISAKEKEVMLRMIDSILDGMDFTTASKKETQRIVWKRIVGKSFMTKREAFALLGFFRKLKQ